MMSENESNSSVTSFQNDVNYFRFLLISLRKGYFDVNNFETLHFTQELENELSHRLTKLKLFYTAKIKKTTFNSDKERITNTKAELLLIYYFISVNHFKRTESKETESNDYTPQNNTNNSGDNNLSTAKQFQSLLNIVDQFEKINADSISEFQLFEVKMVETILQSITVLERAKANLEKLREISLLPVNQFFNYPQSLSPNLPVNNTQINRADHDDNHAFNNEKDQIQFSEIRDLIWEITKDVATVVLNISNISFIISLMTMRNQLNQFSKLHHSPSRSESQFSHILDILKDEVQKLRLKVESPPFSLDPTNPFIEIWGKIKAKL